MKHVPPGVKSSELTVCLLSKHIGNNSMGLDVYLKRTDEIKRYLLFTKIYQFFFQLCTST